MHNGAFSKTPMESNISLKSQVSVDGHWMCVDGEYCKLIERMCSVDPQLRYEDLKAIEQGTPFPGGTPRVVSIQIDGLNNTIRQPTRTDAESFRKYLQSLPKRGPQKQVHLLEGLSPQFIDVLGRHYNMHPSFFADQQRVILFGTENDRPNHNTLQPSVLQVDSGFILRYWEPLHFSTPITTFSIACAATGRHISMTRSGDDYLTVGIVRRKCSFWWRTEPDGGWSCVILCDPPVKRIIIDHYESRPVATLPWQGGFVDFMPREQQMKNPKGPPRTSFLDDFCFYLENHFDCFQELESQEMASTILKKIILSHYMKLIDFVRGTISVRQRKISRRLDLNLDVTKVEKQWSDVQQWERRLSEYCEDAENILLTLGIPLRDPDTSQQQMNKGWLDCSTDFQFVHMRLKQQYYRAEKLNSAMTGLASIAGNRQASHEQKVSIATAKRSIREAKSSKALTMVGLVFIPLAYTSSIFSMSDSFIPGGPQFWVYFVVSCPLIVAVLLAYFFMEFGYSDDSSWSVHNFWKSVKHFFGFSKNGSLHEKDVEDWHS